MWRWCSPQAIQAVIQRGLVQGGMRVAIFSARRRLMLWSRGKRDSYGIPTVPTYPFTIKLPVGDRKLLHTLNPKSYISLYTRNPIALRRWSMAGAVV